MQVCGIDLTSAPTRRKPIMLATASLQGRVLTLQQLQGFVCWDDYEAWLADSQSWIAGFDHPFGLPRELILQLGWPLDWPSLITHYASLSRAEIRDIFRAFCQARPVGHKFAHRACDIPAGASPSMKWVNPPVAYMLKEGAPRLLAAGVHLPGLHDGDPHRIALEAYPGYSARLITRTSYKSDDRAKQTNARRSAREHIVQALMQGRPHDITLRCSAVLKQQLLDDASGDSLDATLCAIQAAVCWHLREHHFGLPIQLDPLEGWIATVPATLPI